MAQNSALIVIDMQNGFLEKESPLCIAQAKQTVPACASVINKAHEKERIDICLGAFCEFVVRCPAAHGKVRVGGL